ncbi:hypothetical protein MKEN_00882100 [Mycena kentingensis (nom. inval.)]|nr:hypothetical protein MKEN_00882100 [Mycena kentingensis (nom. inval.)]
MLFNASPPTNAGFIPNQCPYPRPRLSNAFGCENTKTLSLLLLHAWSSTRTPTSWALQSLIGAPEGHEEGTKGSQSESRFLKPADPVLHEWRAYRDAYLRVLLWRDGRGEEPTACGACLGPGQSALYRCEDCFNGALVCRECCLAAHRAHPFHLVQFWTGLYFIRKPLKDLGLRVQVGHRGGDRCPRPTPARSDFVVIEHNLIHKVSLDFCGCHRTDDPYHIQLLRAGLYPSTQDQPRTCITFACLDRFHALTLQGKVTAYDFYRTLEILTDATGLKPPDRYQVFLRMVREYRHLLALKRAGRGHAPSGVDGTAPGELALRCLACPRPGVNLPDNWTEAPDEIKCIYVLFLALDACFRLKRRNVGTGWAYMVEWYLYRKYLETVRDQKEMSSCSGLAAIDHANTKYSRGYAATGVAMGVSGERYANLDYVFACILKHLDSCLRKVVSYDIVCQWWKKLFERLKTLPPLLRLGITLELFKVLFNFVVPKLHIRGHTLECQSVFSLNIVPGSGQTDGEGIERPWSMLGAVAASSSVSGHGGRADMLDDHLSFWNWRKSIGLPSLLRRQTDKADEESTTQETAFEAFSAEQAERVPAWAEQVRAFEADGSQPNPYEASVKGLSEAQVRESFEKEEAAEESRGQAPIHDMRPAAFIMELLEIEDEQVNSKVELKRAKTTAAQINVRRLRRKLNRRIQRIRAVQATYMPAALRHLDSMDLSLTVAEKIPVVLPSALSEAQRANGGCREGLLELERSLRDAQCRAAIAALRNQLHVKQRLFNYKKRHSRHQAANTRSRALVARNESKVLLRSRKYQAAWQALVLIAGGDETKVAWPRLKREDIRCLEDAEDNARKN